MLTKILEYFGFHPCRDVWAENELLKKQLAAAEVNTSLEKAAYEDTLQERNQARTKYRDACLRIIELEGEVNTLYKRGTHPSLQNLPYPRKD